MKSINKVLIFGLNVLLSCLILALVYSLVYNKIEHKLKGQNVIYEDFYKVDESLTKFDTVKTNIDAQKSSVLDAIRTYQDYLYSNDQNAATYKDKVVAVLNKVGIPVKEKQKNGSFSGNASLKQKGAVITIEMTADYAHLCRFLFEIEKFSVVQEIKVDYENNVSLKCTPVKYSSKIDDYFNDKISTKNIKKDSIEAVSYYEDVFRKTQNLKKQIGSVPTWDDFKPLPRSPFYKYEIPKVNKTPKVYGGSRPDISMDGIMYDAADPIVIIGGKFYHLRDNYRGARIIKINQSSMQVEYYGKIYTYKMKY